MDIESKRKRLHPKSNRDSDKSSRSKSRKSEKKHLKKKAHKKKSKHKKRRSSSSSSSDSSDSSSTSSSLSSSTSSDSSVERKLKLKKKKKKIKRKNELKKNTTGKRESNKKSKTNVTEEPDVGPHINLQSSKIRAPMTKEEYEKQQNTLRWIDDPETGRKRLTRGGGEILESIVSKERHQEINKQATAADGSFFNNQALIKAKSSQL